jgi:hypothetical protein
MEQVIQCLTKNTVKEDEKSDLYFWGFVDLRMEF